MNLILLSDIIKNNAKNFPTKIALICNGAQINYGDLNRLVDDIAVYLQTEECIQVGDKVGISDKSSIEYVAALLAILRVGAVVVPIPTWLNLESQDRILQDCKPSAILTDLHLTRRLSEGTPRPVEVNPNSTCMILYSSGSTEEPKGVAHSHRSRWLAIEKSLNSIYHWSQTTSIVATPLYASIALAILLPTLAGAGTAILMDKFNEEEFLRLATKYKATNIILVPTQYKRILDCKQPKPEIRFKVCTGEPCSTDLKGRILREWPGALIEYYGTTEGIGVTVLEAHKYPNKLHTVGRPDRFQSILIVDKNSAVLPVGEVGEIVGRAPSMMQGYQNKQTNALVHEGYTYFRTGDLGKFDTDGFLIVVGREKDMIVSGGFNVYPLDIETALMKHHAVKECAVIGVPSDFGESPYAFVVRRDDYVLRDDILSWVNQRLGKVQRLKGLQFIEELPRNSLGKLVKRELKKYVE